MDKDWTSRAEQPGIGRTLESHPDPPLPPPPSSDFRGAKVVANDARRRDRTLQNRGGGGRPGVHGPWVALIFGDTHWINCGNSGGTRGILEFQWYFRVVSTEKNMTEALVGTPTNAHFIRAVSNPPPLQTPNGPQTTRDKRRQYIRRNGQLDPATAADSYAIACSPRLQTKQDHVSSEEPDAPGAGSLAIPSKAGTATAATVLGRLGRSAVPPSHRGGWGQSQGEQDTGAGMARAANHFWLGVAPAWRRHVLFPVPSGTHTATPVLGRQLMGGGGRAAGSRAAPRAARPGRAEGADGPENFGRGITYKMRDFALFKLGICGAKLPRVLLLSRRDPNRCTRALRARKWYGWPLG
eukprot:gene22170-biopygen22222